MTNPRRSSWANDFIAKHRGTLLVIQAVVLVVLGYSLASMIRGGSTSVPEQSDGENVVTEVSAGPTIWTCSMHPQVRQPNPGDCPFCGMDLIPMAKSSGGLRTLTVSPEARALMSIETAPVERRYVSHNIRMVGKVDYDETKLGYITAWVAGRLDRLYVDYTGVEVKKGDHMVYIYSEDLYSAQQELIQAKRFANQRGNTPSASGINLVEAAREKLRLLGLADDQIKQIEQQNRPTDRVTIYSPVSGVVIEKLRQEGERVRLGDRIYTIADLNLVWVHLDVYESDLSWIRYGQDVTITTDAYPGEEFHGRIAFIQPVLNDKTRTVKVRVNVPNVEGKLKPEMFVHATVHPKVAAGGRVMDPSLAGKWICPMHPEEIEATPGKCSICGMPLVRAESLGYVTPETDQRKPPLVIPRQAALVTGTRAVVYVELPSMPSTAEAAFRTLSTVVQEGNLDKTRAAFATYAVMLDLPYDQPGTDYAKSLWNSYADILSQHALMGSRAQSMEEAEQAFGRIEIVMTTASEQFAASGQPTFQGREIVLGPRAGNYYLVRHGLEEGELVVRQGNFKIDSEIQLQAKPSMMTPEGGGASQAAKGTSLPTEFQDQVRDLYGKFESLTKALQDANLGASRAAFDEIGKTLAAVDGQQLTGPSRMLWKELFMLLGNDIVEGQDAKQLKEMDRVYLLLKGHMRRMREQLGVTPDQQRHVQRIVVDAGFQTQLARIWKIYLAIQQSLAADDFQAARKTAGDLASATTKVDDTSLDDRARQVWVKERTNLGKLIDSLPQANDLDSMRAAFSPFSQEIGVLAKAFGFGNTAAVYELHCPMAFDGRGAIWYQDNDGVKNPYYGSSMLKCADRVQKVVRDQPSPPDAKPPQDHSGHK